MRRAETADVAELIRLRHAMFREMESAGVAGRPDKVEDVSRYPAASRLLTEQLTTGAVGAFVVADANGASLIACAVATVEQRLPGPGFSTGRAGSMSSVFVDPRHRGCGLARAVVAAAVSWLDAQGAEVTDIHTTPAAAHLYRSLGFAEPKSASLRRLTAGQAAADPPLLGAGPRTSI